MGKPTTAKLAHVKLERVPYLGDMSGWALIANGVLYEDSRGRPNGDTVITSRIEKVDGNKIYTQNSVYEVI